MHSAHKLNLNGMTFVNIVFHLLHLVVMTLVVWLMRRFCRFLKRPVPSLRPFPPTPIRSIECCKVSETLRITLAPDLRAIIPTYAIEYILDDVMAASHL